ncbi:phosphoesterase [Clostridia bacterium]|nr:phosphoesterase [Clostridia bacterium]
MFFIFLLYLTIISIIAIVLTIHDKNAARKQTWRVKERTLFLISVLGGSIAMLITMRLVRHKTQRKKFMIGIPLIIAIQLILVFAFSQRLTIRYFHISTNKINNRIKLALITDLHACDYGTGQYELIRSIEEEKPDVILLCGDIFDDKIMPNHTIELLEGVASKYPCYYVTGNHEFWSDRVDEFKDIFRSFGVKVLTGTSEILEIADEKVQISGIDDPDTDRYSSKALSYEEQMEGLKTSLEPGMFTIMMSHRPERITELLSLNPELVVSGHAHGGQWRIPYILENGLYAPHQGIFPKYTNGIYHFGDTKLIVSRGLARETTIVPRIFNRPELVMITIQGI